MMSIQTQQKIYDRYPKDYNKSSFKQLPYLKERQQQILTLTAVQRCQQQIYNSLYEENNSTTAISI